jgi:hypothetical protein
MPTNRRVRKRVRHETIDPLHWAILNDELPPDDANRFTLLDREDYKAMLLPWEEHRKVIIADWIKSKPGTRPSMWWRYDAPRLAPEALGRWSRTVLAPQLIELRRKLRGEGNPLHEVLNYTPSQHYGIPAWCGNPDDPPVFESQRTYLKRHGLLLPAERRKIEEPFPHPLRIVAGGKWKWPKGSPSVI